MPLMTDKKEYEAFRLQLALHPPGQQRVESLCCWKEYLLVGLYDGAIVQYGAQAGTAVWQILKAHRSLERKAVIQMAAVRLAAKPLLLALSEDGVNLHTLPDMQLKFQPMGSRGASMFAWSEDASTLAVAVRRRVILYQLRGSELLEAGERIAPDAISAMAWVGAGLLMLGMRRQYALLNTTTGAVTDVAPVGLAPVPLAHVCPGGQEILLARDSTTYFHNVTDGRYSRRRHLAWSEPLLALAAVGQYAVAVTAGGLEVRSLRRVAEGHVVQRVALAEPARPATPAVSESGAVFIVCGAAAGGGSSGGSSGGAAGAGGSIFRLVPVPLEEQAHTLAELGEYGEALALAALVEDGGREGEGEGGAGKAGEAGEAGEAGSAGGATAEYFAQGRDAEAGAKAGGARGAPEPAASAGGGGAPAASASAGGGGGGGGGRRALLEERLRLAYGHYLFNSGEYDEGMAQLALCKSTTALVLLRLFPSLVPPKFQHYLPHEAAGQPLPRVPEPAGEAYGVGVSQLLPYLLSHRTRAIAALADTEAVKAAAASAPGCERAGEDCGKRTQQEEERASSHAQASSSLPSRQPHPAPTAAGGGPHTSKSSNGTGGDPNAGKLGNGAGGGGGAAPAAAAAAAASAAAGGQAGCVEAAPATSPAAAAPPLPPLELLHVLDTAIVRIMVVMPDTGGLLRFVQLPNYVDLREGEQALAESGMYAELAALYKYNGCHDEGLELLHKLSQDPAALPRPARGAAADLPGLPGVWAAVRYMVSVSAEATAAILQRHAGWILAADPEAGLSALLHMRPPLNPSLALSILNQHSRHYCGLYLETALQIGVALPQDYHNELLLIYLRDILAKEALSPSRASTHSGDELKELLLAQRPDKPPLLFPDELAAALHHHHGSGGAADGRSGADTARRFASVPASSTATPTGVSRVPSQVSLLNGHEGRPGAPRGVGAASRGGGTPAASRMSPAPGGSETEDSDETTSGTESEAEAGAGAAHGEARAAGAGAAAVAARLVNARTADKR
ncbi:Vam6/Vps39-like protein, partial [Tetrabaena socialis]